MDNQKTYKIVVEGISEAYNEVVKLRDALESLEKDTKKSSQGTKALTDAEIKATEATKEHVKAVREEHAVESAKQKILNASTNTYAEKQKMLTALGKVIKNTNAQTEEEKALLQEQIRQYNALNNELKSFDEQLGNHQRKVGQYENATKSLRSELKEMQAQLAQMLANGERGSEAYIKLAEKAGFLKDAINDANAEINRFASDTQALDGVINVAQTAAASFGVLQSATALFGVENEKLVRSIQKLQAITTLIQSLQTLQNAFKANTFVGGLYNKLMNSLFGTNKKVAASLVTTATAANATSKGFSLAATATKLFGSALKALPMIAIISAISSLVEWLTDLFTSTEENVDAQNDLANAFDRANSRADAYFNTLQLINSFKISRGVMTDLESLGVIADERFKYLKKTINDTKGDFKDFSYLVRDWENVDLNNTEQVAIKLEKLGQQASDAQIDIDRLTKSYGENMSGATDAENATLAEARAILRLQNAVVSYLTASNSYTDAKNREKEAAERAAQQAANEAKQRAKAAAEQRKREEEELKKQAEESKKYWEKLAKENTEKSNELKLEAAKAAAESYNVLIKNMRPPLSEDDKKNLEEYIAQYTKFARIVNETNHDIVNANYDEKYQKTLNEALEHGVDTNEKAKALQDALNNIDTERLQKLKAINEEQEKEVKNINDIITHLKGEDLLTPLKQDMDGFLTHLLSASTEFEAIKQKMNLDKKQGLFGAKAYQQDKKYLLELQGLIVEDGSQFEQYAMNWEAYVDGIGKIYGKDSEQFKQAQQDKINAINNFKQAISGVTSESYKLFETNTNNSTINGVELLIESVLGEDWQQRLTDVLGSGFTAAFVGTMEVSGQYLDAMSDIYSRQIEMARDNVDSITTLYEKASEKVSASQEKIKGLEDEIKDASGAEKEELKRTLAEEELLYAQRNAEAERLNQEKLDAEAQLRIKEAKAKKLDLEQQRIQAIASTAAGAAKAYSQFGWPLGAVFAALITAMGMAQVNVISQQIGKIKYADGGLLEGASHAEGGMKIQGTNVEVEGGEYIINKQATKQYLPLLERINNSTLPLSRQKSVTKFENGGEIDPTLLQQTDYNSLALMNAIGSMNMNPIVTVTDYNHTNDRLVRVKDFAGSR